MRDSEFELEMQTLSIGKKKRIHAVEFSPSGNLLATASGDLQVRIWDLATGTVHLAAPIRETSCGYDLAFLDEDRLVFAGTELSWWDIPENVWNLIAPGYSWGRRIAVSPARDLLVEVDQTRSTDWAGGRKDSVEVPVVSVRSCAEVSG